ncbi:MAG: DUF4340 domain-containing protein [Planctomycetota bacterium]
MLAAALVVLAVGFGIAYFGFGLGQIYDKVEAGSSEPLFGKIDKNQIQSVSIKGPKEEVELKRKSEKDWVVATQRKKVEGKDEWKASSGDYKADQNSVDSVLRELTELGSGRIISRKADGLDKYELDDAKRVHVVANGAGEVVLADFFVGKSADDITGCFIRKSDDTGVRKIDRNIRLTFDKGASGTESWRDRTVLSIDDQTKITGFVVEGGGRTVRLARAAKPAEPSKTEDKDKEKKEGEAKAEEPKPPEKDAWEILEPIKGPIESWMADSLKRNVAPMQADSFYEGDKKAADLGLDPPEYKITIQIEGKDPVVVHVGKEEDSKRYVQVPGQATIFQSNSWRVREFIKEPKDFLTAAAKKELEDKEKAEKEKADKDKAATNPPPAAPEGEKKPDAPADGGGAPSSSVKPADKPSGKDGG